MDKERKREEERIREGRKSEGEKEREGERGIVPDPKELTVISTSIFSFLPKNTFPKGNEDIGQIFHKHQQYAKTYTSETWLSILPGFICKPLLSF